ncbi:AlpA family phage regulatory protein [Guyparkeria sp. SB14A]|uniref:helix-turn-helix transcriptional regulator n=2 Tax=Guyparkeria TaxID=2035712 RepID=UPI0010ABACD7|nr:AlpA family phage regulatory protein [Guyparkeria sp. SB14A]
MKIERGIEARAMNAQEVAAHCGMGRSTLYQMIRSGEFPEGMMVGWGRRWLREEVDAWLDQQFQVASERQTD